MAILGIVVGNIVGNVVTGADIVGQANAAEAGLCGGCAAGVLTGAGFGLLANGYSGAGIANSAIPSKASGECGQ